MRVFQNLQVVDFLVVDFFDAVGAEGLHASSARHGGGGDDLCLSAFEKGAEINFRVEHEFLSAFAIGPEAFRRVEAGG